MREIKFRAWDKNEQCWFSQSGDYRYKEYQYLIAIGLHGLPIAVSKDSFKNDEVIGWNRDHNIELMQYTGLKDKNGVEIYEGDIVRVKFNSKQVINGEVSFDKGCFMWYQIPQMYGTELVGLVHESEVIGNIYEHAHLLEVKE